ncbi:MAG TPA: sulfotransferase, partial [Aestuariivirgaceae bacterium]|nr:sulfotransferase [Aestuariivirgaceae bacterium]
GLVADSQQDPDVWAGYGRALAAQGAAEEAIQAYKRAQELKPGDEAIEQGLAAVYLSIGRIDLAEIHFRNALNIKPDVGTYRHSLARLKRLRDDELTDAQSRLSLLPPNDPKRVPLLTTIAIIAERTGDYGSSFNATMEALSLINAGLPKKYDAAAAISLTDRVIAKIGIRACRQVYAATARPIFIIGMPRSGSTLTEQILARHPSVFAAGEWRAMYKVRRQMHEMGKPYPDRLDDLSDDEIGKLRATYFSFLPEATNGRSHITDKALGNVYNLASIERIFPEAVIVRTRRHPMDSLWSILQLAYGSNMPYASRIQDICNEVIQQHRVYAAFAERGTLSVMDLFYEELVERFEEGARSLVSFAGLTWNDACLQPQEARRAVFTASAGQVNEPISKSSIGRWKPFAPYLTQAIDALKPSIELHEAELAKRGISYA